MTNQVTVETIELTEGMKVENTLPNGTVRAGEIFKSGKGEMKVRFNDEKGRVLSCLLSDKWSPVTSGAAAPAEVAPAADVTALDAILENAAAVTSSAPAESGVKAAAEVIKKATAAAPAEVAPAAPVTPLTADEKKRLAKLEKEYFSLDEKEKQIHFGKGRILKTVSTEQLWRESDKNFATYAFRVFGITREYAQNLAQIGGFAEVAAELLANKDINVSVRAANEVIRGGNKIAAALGVENADNAELGPILNQILELAVSATKDETSGKSEPTGKQVTEIANLVSAALQSGDAPADTEGKTVLQLAAEKLGASKADILQKYRDAIAAGKGGETKRNGGPSGSSNPDNKTKATELWAGAMPVISASCSVHPNTAATAKAAAFENRITWMAESSIQLKCGCRFNMQKLQAAAIECEGKRVVQK